MAQGNKRYPLMDERGFIVNAIFAGEMSSGKSTCLNAILGDCLATTDIDRSTTTAQRYYESIEKKNNNGVLDKSDEINDEEDEKYQNDLKKLEKYNKKIFAARWIDQLRGKVPKPSFPDTIPSQPVTESALMPRIGKFDNTFSLIDLPGFNDPTLDDEVFAKLASECNEMDYIFYIVDCQTCFKNKASQDYWKRFIDTVKSSIINGFTRLVILFNKYDTISVRDNDKKFVQRKRDELEKELIETHGINKSKFKFFNISANNLLVQRILKNQDVEFLQSHEKLMDDINSYAGEYLSRRELTRLKKLGIKERLLAINEAIESEKEKNRLEDLDDDMDIDGEGHTPGTTPGASEDEKNELSDETEQEENLDEVLIFLRELRDVRVLSKKAQKYLTDLNIDSAEELGKFFGCVFCLTRNDNNSNGNNNENKQIKDLLDINLEQVMRQKLESMFTTINGTGNIALLNQCLIECLKNLQYCLPSLDDNKFVLKEFIRFLTLNKYLQSNLIGQIGQFIDGNSESSKIYFKNIGMYFTDALVDEYQRTSGKQDIVNVDGIIDYIFKYYDNIRDQSRLLVVLLTYYPKVTQEESYDSCRAIDLMNYHFDIDVLRKLFIYSQYEHLCAKRVKSQDRQFGKLIQYLSNVSHA